MENEIERRHAEWQVEKTGGTVYSGTVKWKTKDGIEHEATRWIAEFSFRDHAGKTRTFRDTKASTKKAGDKALAALRDRAWLAKAPPEDKLAPQTVRAYLKHWHAERVKGVGTRDGKPLRGTTSVNELRHVELLCKLIGDEQLRGLTKERISKLFELLKTEPRIADVPQSEREPGRAYGLRGRQRAQAHVYQTLHKALSDADLSGDLFTRGVKPRSKAKQVSAFHPRDLAEILTAVDRPREGSTLVDESFSAIIHVLAHTGVRIGECLALQWVDIDFDAGRLHVRASMAEVGKLIERTATKSGHERVIPLRPALVDRLRRLRAQLGAIPHPRSLVFSNEKGRPLRKSNLLRRKWHPVLTELELDLAGFHKLRHSFASISLQAGVDIATVSRLLGHSGVAITLTTYTHYLEGRAHEAPAAIETALERAAAGGARHA